MCGFVGFIGPGWPPDDGDVSDLIVAMRDTLRHRGPDDAGDWLDPEAGVAFGFRRLSIQDLSDAGHQPMVSSDGRWVLMLNGEIYNAGDIRVEIEATFGARRWRGHCDTESLVEAIAVWGIEAAIGRLNGMFAFAVWDREARALWLARDRIGKKPLFYGWAGDYFVFGSELKALWHHPGFDRTVSRTALSGFLQRGYVLGPATIFETAWKLPGGHLLRMDRGCVADRAVPASVAYWSLHEVAVAGLEAQAVGGGGDIEELAALLDDSVARRMTADVPVGAFLSGGVDSSLVTALMAGRAAAAVPTFSIGFYVSAWDETRHAAAVAGHLQTRHHTHRIGAADVLSAVETMPVIYDEPFADDSFLPTFLLSRLARQDVTVALSGDGGDELFAGYHHYGAGERWIERRNRVPAALRDAAGRAAGALARAVTGRRHGERMGRRLHLLSDVLLTGDPDRFGMLILSQTFDPAGLMAGGEVASPTAPAGLGRSGAVDRMAFNDTLSFLVDDIMAKVDRASMACSLEVRSPLLDHRIVELSWRFSAADKLHGGVGKHPLRALLARHMPRPLFDRPKMGFSAPIPVWLRQDLAGWAGRLMSREALGSHGLLDVDECRALWEGFARHGNGWTRVIWNILMFQAWYEAVSKSRAASPTRRASTYAAVART